MTTEINSKSPTSPEPQTPALALDPGSAESLLATLKEQNRELRTMCAIAHCGLALYHDDGELQDTREQPWIDWKRDPVEEIQRKLYERMCRRPLETSSPNDIDEPRLRLARLLPRRRRDGRGRWLWRLVRLLGFISIRMPAVVFRPFLAPKFAHLSILVYNVSRPSNAQDLQQNERGLLIVIYS
jgi:hypothetical protein